MCINGKTVYACPFKFSVGEAPFIYKLLYSGPNGLHRPL